MLDTIGVSQGLELGPPWFTVLLIKNDNFDILKFASLVLFADDLNLFAQHFE